MRQDVYNEVKRQMKQDIKINCSEIARRFNCDPRTVKSYMNGKKPKRRTTLKPSILDDYKDIIIDKIDNYGATGKAAYYFIKKKGYPGSYTTVKKFVRKHKSEQLKRATVRFETVPGLQAQVDWKEEFKLINRDGQEFTFNIFLYISGYSRMKYFEITTDRKQDTLFRCLINAFRFNQGPTQEIWFDNMHTVVDRPNTVANNVKINAAMQQFAKDMGFGICVCRAYRPQTKGKGESLAKLVDRLVVFNREFDTMDDLKAIVKEFNKDINNEICQTTGQTPYERHQYEKEYLLPIPSKDLIASYTNSTIKRRVSKESMITFNEKKYSVPVMLIGETVEITPYANTIQIYFKGEQVATHNLSSKVFNYDIEHLKDILKSDVYRYKDNDEIEAAAKEHLYNMDQFLGGNL